jgi:hypothetical protein
VESTVNNISQKAKWQLPYFRVMFRVGSLLLVSNIAYQILTSRPVQHSIATDAAPTAETYSTLRRLELEGEELIVAQEFQGAVSEREVSADEAVTSSPGGPVPYTSQQAREISWLEMFFSLPLFSETASQDSGGIDAA